MKTVTLCGSMKFADEMKDIALQLEINHNVNVIQCIYNAQGIQLSDDDMKQIIEAHYKKIELSDAISLGTTDELEEIVRGTYVNPYKDAEDFNEKVGDNTVFAGYAQDLEKAGFADFIFWDIFWQGVITFVVSGILAFLYYLIWQTDADEDNKKKVVIAKKKKAKK